MLLHIFMKDTYGHRMEITEAMRLFFIYHVYENKTQPITTVVIESEDFIIKCTNPILRSIR